MFSSLSLRLYVDPAAERLTEVVRHLEGYQRQPVSTATIAGWTGWAERTVRHYLAQAEHAGLVHRPDGPRCGWSARRPVQQIDLNQLIQLRLPERG